MNLQNEVRFGPDVEWLEAPVVDGEDEMDFWTRHLAVTEARMADAIREVKKFLPGVQEESFAPDCELFVLPCELASLVDLEAASAHEVSDVDVGIRPKLARKGSPALDFSITHPRPGFISLLGIESPGLTSSLAIGERVEAMVRREVWGLGKGTGRRVSEGGRIDAWA